MWQRRNIYLILIAFITLCAITAITTTPKNSKKISTFSAGENVSSNIDIESEIEHLTTETNSRRLATEFWDTWNIRFLFAAGFVAVCLSIIAVGVSTSNRRYVAASNELNKAKDRKLTSDLQDKDLKIAQLGDASAILKSENLKLEVAIAPRRLTARQETALSGLSKFANRSIGIKSYSSDTEGLILATQILDALVKAKLSIEDNRLTMQPAGSVSFGISVSGPDTELVKELERILSLDGNLTASSVVAWKSGFSTSVSFGQVRSATPPVAVITVGVKPISMSK
jgi:hypothetical protein